MPTRYIAESVAAFEIIKDWPHRPTTDEGHAMSAPVTVCESSSLRLARHELAMHVLHSCGSDADQQKIHFAASDAIEAGVDAVQISGRVFRIRTVTEGA